MPFLPDMDMEYDPDGSTEQVAVVMKGKTYRLSGLNKSKFPSIEGPLYDKLCEFPRHKYRDEVRKLAMNIAIMANENNFKPTVEWLDNFMRRFCLSTKKSGLYYKKNFLKIKGFKSKEQATAVVNRKTASLQNDTDAVETNQETHDPLDIGENHTTFKAPNGISENSSILRDDTSASSSETVPFSPSTVLVTDILEIEKNMDEQNLNNNDNGDHGSDSDDSIKVIPREKSPDKEIISLIDSDDEIVLSKESIKEEWVNNDGKGIVSHAKATEHTKPTDQPSEQTKPTEKSKKGDKDLENPNDYQKQEEQTGKESEKGKEDSNDKDKDEEEKEEEEEETIELDDETDSDSEDSSSDMEKSGNDDDDDLVVKQRKSWEDMNFVKYSKRDEKFYSNNMSNLQKKLDEKITQCTACFEQVNHTVKEEIFTHPVLGVLVCKKCFRFYGKGNFKKDADGYDEYCRWCANGGDLLLCDHCTNGFCKKCIKRNLGRAAESEAIKSKSWKCYVCDLAPLTEVRAFNRAVIDQLRSVSIIKKSLSRKEKSQWSIKQKFSVLQMKRKTQGFATTSNISKKNPPTESAKKKLPTELNKENMSSKVEKENSSSEFARTMRDIQDLCNICIEQVNFIGRKSFQNKTDDSELKCQRRLLRLVHHMEDNFNKIKVSLGESSGLNVEEILISNNQNISKDSGSKGERNKKRRNSSHQNPDTLDETPHKEDENKKRQRESANSGGECKSPPTERIVMETDEEMETEQKESDEKEAEIVNNKNKNVIKSTNNNNNNKNNNNNETSDSNKGNDSLQTNSSNEDVVMDTPFDDAASNKNSDGETEREEIEDTAIEDATSSKNPDGDTEREEIEDTPFDDAASSKNPDGDTEKEEIEDETVKTKSFIKSKSSSQKSLSDSERDLSQSLLKDVQSTQNISNGPVPSTSSSKESKDKSASSDDSNSSKKGIIYRKSKTLKKRLNMNSDKDESNEVNNSDENLSKNEDNNESSSPDKLKKKLLENSNCNDDENKEKVNKTKDEEDCDSNKKEKRCSKSQSNLKSLLQTDSDDSDEEKEIKKPSRKLGVKIRRTVKKKKKSNYKPRPKSVMEAIKNKQLKSGSVIVEKLPKIIRSKLEEEKCIYISDYPEYFAKDIDLGLESESDRELDTILKTKTQVLRKRKLSDDSENDADSEDNSQNEDENEPEKKEKKPANKKCKKEEKVGLMDINLENEEGDNNDDDDDVDEDGDDNDKKTIVNMNMKSLLVSSEDEEEIENEEDSTLNTSGEMMTQEELEKKKRELYEKNKKKEKDKNNSESDNEEILQKVKKKGFLSFKFSTSEEDEDESENETPRKSRMFIESDSDFEISSKKKKRSSSVELFTSSEDDDEESTSDSDERGKKKSRKRIKRPSSSTEDDDEANENDLETPKKRHRKIIRDEDLLQSTKDATQEEKERRDRVKDRQSKYNKIFEIDVEKDQSDKKKLVLDFDEETKEDLVKVNEKVVCHLKPHQFDGIKFMWDATVESVDMLEKGERGGGCILAHCMGLGKTLQVIAFIHTLLTSKHVKEKISRVMVCCPVNTVYNWKAEFKQWLRGKLDTFDVVELVSAKDLWARAYRLEDWYNEGGVCIVGYDMFRNLSNDKNKRYKGSLKDKFQKCLVNPGADLMVCDEGHILKNEKTALSIAINKIKTRRRIVLTGTPLQNSLKEYHCMIQFVKPNLLGSKKEFMNRFVHPIEAGQCVEALKKDVSRMKKRAHILHNLLEGCVQRFDYTVLKPFLPPKYEYVISVQMGKEQIKLYEYYLQNLAQGGPKRHGSGLFVDFNNLSRIWSHPVVLYYALDRFRDQDFEEIDNGSDLDGFIDDDEDSDSFVDSSEEEKRKKKKSKKKKNEVKEEVEEIKETEKIIEEAPPEVEVVADAPGLTMDGKVRRDWYKKVVEEMCNDDLDEDSFFNRIEISGKLYLLFDILLEAGSIGDKVLLFSQSIMVLDMIQEFLRMVENKDIKFPPEGKEDSSIPQPFKHWVKEKDYIRLDGSSAAEARKDMCKIFNNPSNERCRLFLISTKAGGIGINLVGANRVIIFDSSWNPSNDTQSIFRVYRFGQKKPCYIYRFVAQGTMEEKIYSRQVAKMSTARRVVDEHQIKRHFNMAQLSELYEFTPADPTTRDTPAVPEDKLLAELLIRNKNHIVSYHEHDSLLENQAGEELTEEERNAAWEDYENEKKGIVPQSKFPVGFNLNSLPTQNMVAPFDIENIYRSVVKVNPNGTQSQIYESVYLAVQQIQRVHLSQFQNLQALMYNMATNPTMAPELLRSSMFKDRTEMIAHYDAQLRILENNIQAETNVLKQIGAVTKRVVPQSSKLLQVAAGLARGNPPIGNVSSTAQYVSRNIPVSNKVNTTLIDPLSKPSTSNSVTPALTSSSTAGTSTKPINQEEITLE